MAKRENVLEKLIGKTKRKGSWKPSTAVCMKIPRGALTGF